MIRTLLASTALLLAACATAPTSVPSGDDLSGEAKLFADFLAGTYASNVEDAEARAAYYSRAFARAPDDPFIGRRALSFALLNGDLVSARAIATDLARLDPTEPMARLVLGERAFARGNEAEALRYFEAPTADFTMGIAMQIQRGWAQYAAGDAEAARKTFEELPGGPVFETLGQLQLALIDGEQGRTDQALDRLGTVETAELFETEAAITKAAILANSDRHEEAIDGLVAFNSEGGNLETGPAANLVQELRDGKSPQIVSTPRTQAAAALTAPSFPFFVRGGALDAAEIYLRFALDLDPDYDLAKILLGNILVASDRNDEALALYRSIKDESDYVVSGRLAEANVYFDRDEDAKALEVLEAIAALKPAVVTREALGRARLIRENYAEALPIYDALVESLTPEQLASDPTPLYLRAVALEREDRFTEAVRDFRRVLEIDPDNAEALNYLGYTWVDRGENLREAFDMIEKAVELEPDSGAITDSLGWAHYKLGNYTEARRYLEKAAELSPSSATIIDHLGDVYWKLGRYREAGYQWERALDLDPTDEERTAIVQKLERGLEGTRTVSADPAP